MKLQAMGWGIIGALTVMLLGAPPLVAQEEMEGESLGTELPGQMTPSGSAEPPAVIDITTVQMADDGQAARISMNLQDADLKDVLKVFSQQSRINIIATTEVEDKKITLFLENVAVQDALDQILRATELISEKLPQSDIHIVKPAPTGEQGNLDTITRIYKLRYARVSNSVLGRAASSLIKGVTPFEAFGARSLTTGNAQGVGGGLGGSAGGLTNVESGGIDVVLAKMLTENGSIVGDERTNSLVITDLQTNFPRIEAAIAQLDVRTPQVLVEVELVEISTTKAKHLGIEYGSGSSGTLVQLTPATYTSEFPFENSTAAGALATSVASAAGTPTLGFIDTAKLQMVLKALEQDTNTRILARPKVLTMDNESAVIRLTEDTAIAITSTTISESGNVTTEVERSRTGVILSVTPQVNADGFITMLVEPSVNKPVTSSLTSQSQSILNPKERSARALVRLKDGSTFVMGGLIDRKEETTMRKVPILGDIPLLGLAFRKQTIDNTDSELLVFITPHIVRDEDMTASAPATARLMYAREQERLGSREAVVEDALNRWEQRRRLQK